MNHHDFVPEGTTLVPRSLFSMPLATTKSRHFVYDGGMHPPALLELMLELSALTAHKARNILRLP